MTNPAQPMPSAPAPFGSASTLVPKHESLRVIEPGVVLLGAYQVLELIGSGGQSQVYRLESLHSRLLAAVKVFTWSGAQTDQKERWQREFRVLHELAEHPSVVRLLDVGTYENGAFVILEYLPASVERLIREHSLGMPPGDSIRICGECAEALHFAHERGIFHRDIKPSNLLLEGLKSPVKVCDFGLARGHEDTCLTVSGCWMGTPGFSAPEQLGGSVPDPRWDIYALGMTLAAMLAGTNAPRRETILDDLRRTLEIRWRDRLLPVLERAIAYEPAGRFASMRELAEVLRNLNGTISSQGSDIFNQATRPGMPPCGLGPRAIIEVPAVSAIGLRAWVFEFDAYSVLHMEPASRNVPLERGDLQQLHLPNELLARRYLGLVFSGPLPVWIYAYLAIHANAFAWVGTYAPHFGGAVVVKRFVPSAPEIGSVVEVPDPTAVLSRRNEHEAPRLGVPVP